MKESEKRHFVGVRQVQKMTLSEGNEREGANDERKTKYESKKERGRMRERERERNRKVGIEERK